mmetsp:Transcript_41663/g.61157  ORF Transcript_41663/g.61157 Transcript_41663/m.61157 type:complete len:394 (-) Transcript_41663:465-1646(-)|eukprot:CAMPEP_0195518968 /NCGR_PEP_ID=MMETSP0794_2-20130614/14064_1 /TAXON_ID=515487 /ORGANISM="Stephanopyxis turris, Strain CCMP 815" /LENGTH=393 /DNA_ID=CAMNT_0040648029 /DNA_START=49 /DNA_END=1230 /DNA_ORIENTATION=-
MSETVKPAASGTNYLIVASYLVIVGLWISCQLVDVPYVVNLLFLVTSILYVACHKSLILREEQAISRGEGPPDDDGNRPEAQPSETLKKEDAMQFPLVGSASLFSLYCAFKFFDKDMVNLLISGYFCLIGCLALTVTFAPVFEKVLPSKFANGTVAKEIKINHPLPKFIGGEPWDLGFEFSGAEALSFLGSAVFCVFYFKTRHWTMNNVLGIAFCLQGIERFSLGTYKIGAILLVGLFFYDIFWVFGTDVMVTVAKNLDGPIKILFPRSLIPNETTGKIELSLLGLGDIVIPGFFLALLLRFDAANASVPTIPTNIHASFPKPYFHSCLLAYVAGLATTLVVMIKFEAAQPALLYLVPACLGSSLLCAVVRGELKTLFAYSEEEEERDDKKEE